ncbi:MAG: DEAD/DEAH box helicase [Alphaproteobacteria bacterium]|nr:DEAD/DEAH box helicase [Alphaproteobacteria bacterium]
MKQFNDLGLAEVLLRAVSAEGYTTPTPIQVEVIPAMLAGRDIVGIAQTGTGKTAAFVLPLLHNINQQRVVPGSKCCTTLILAPTRELAAQIAESIRTYGRFMRPSVAVIIGGAKPGPQIRAVAGGVDIIVATPGRLLDHMASGVIRLDRTTTVILDEGDQMLDLGFMPAIRRIMAKLPAKRQTMLLSATMPKQIRDLAHDFLNNPAEIAVAQVARPIERINQKVMHVDSTAKRGVLVDLLGGPQVERAIVFTRTKRGADKVSLHLQKAGLSTDAIHGNKSQSQRERTLAAFRSGRVTILVATDIAARGIDVDDVSHVVNYELPNVPEAYVHRIGRTARAGKNGVAISLCDHTERGMLRDIERLIGCSLNASGDLVPHVSMPQRSAATAGEPTGAKTGQKRNSHARNHRGKSAAAEPTRRSEAKPGNAAANAGLTRMLGTAGDKQKRRRSFAKSASGSSHGRAVFQ